jgi:diguanylate cyclase (GGDEF)-like protein/PAS domain S-box-containing protein
VPFNRLMKRLEVASFVVLALTAGAGSAWALDPRKSISEYHRQSWQTEQGLPQNTVFNTAQTRDGYLWFGTIGGLARFDGVRFTTFLPSTSPGLKNGIISRLCPSRDGGLWIGTEGGLIKYKDGAFTSYAASNPLAGDPVMALHEDRDGVVWLGSTGPGLVRLKDGKFRRYGAADGFPEVPARSIDDDASGNLWVGTGVGLMRVRDEKVTTFTMADGLGEERISAVYVDHEGGVWAGGNAGTKTRYHDGRFTVYPAAPGRGAGIFAIREDADGQTWFATSGAGLERIYNGRVSSYFSQELASLRSLLFDHEGSLWVGTSAYGVQRLRDTSLITYSLAEGLVDKTVRSLAQVPDGRIFVSNRYSLRVFENGRFSEQKIPEPRPTGLFPLLVDRRGGLWMGTTDYLARWSGGKWAVFLTDFAPNLYVHALHEDRQGNLWAGTERGAFVIHEASAGASPSAPGAITRYTKAEGLASDQVFAIDEDREGGIWLGTRGGGVSVFKEGRFTSYSTEHGLSGNSIRNIYADPDGSVWIGTVGQGLTRFRAGRFTKYRTADGLLDDSVAQIVDDGQGSLWMCGVEGISRVSKQELDDFAEGRVSQIRPRGFGTGDGMRAKACSNLTQPAATRMQDGRIWFATLDGVVVVDPKDSGRHNDLPPPVVVEALRVDRQLQPERSDIDLPAGSREIELEYTALSFAAPEKVKFKYRLEGYDADWVDPGTRRTAYYMNLRPGRYAFRVKAANNDGVWNDAGAALSFRLRPHFYETSWFLGLCGIALLVGGRAFLQLRLRHLKRREAELAAHVTERTRELELEIAERQRVEEALRESEERYSLAVRGANDGLWDWNLRTSQVYFSPRWKAILGHGEDEIGDNPEEWLTRVHAEDLERVKAGILAVCEGRATHFEDEHRIRHKDGTDRWVLTRGFAVRDPEGRAYRLVGAQTDVTDRRSYDALTGLPNRALFVDRLTRALARAARNESYMIGVLFLDLDRLKVVNDSLGHLAGDQLIVSIARELEACVRPGDMIARFGGDEFAVLVDNIAGVADATRVAERIHGELQGIFSIAGAEVYASASIGIAVGATGLESAEDLLRDADTAMYRAKANGRGRYEVFDAAMRAHVMALLELEGEFRRAVERGELAMHYQPMVDLATGALCGLEALVRWHHPRRGLILPDQFIGMAEETGLILPLGYWVLRDVCRQMKIWHRELPAARHLAVSVNISARQFIDRELVNTIRGMLEEGGLAPHHLVLEITESAIMSAEGAGGSMLAELSALGVRLHIDDFGTGYSSLGYLHRFPVDALKIDRSFVSQMAKDGDALVRTILTLARNLGIPAIAEGVETEEQLQALRTLGCELAQGYYFGRAVNALDTGDLIAAGRVWDVAPRSGHGMTAFPAPSEEAPRS